MGNLKESESLNLGSVPEGLLLVCLVRSSALSGSLHSSYLSSYWVKIRDLFTGKT